MRTRAALLLALAGALLAAGGCKMIELGRETREAKTVGGIAGKVAHREKDGSSVVVFALREDGAAQVPANYARLTGGDRFLLRLEAGKRYRVGAFADRNGNLLPDANEPAALAPDTLTVAQGWQGIKRADVALAPAGRLAPAEVAALQTLPKVERIAAPVAIGEVAAIDDARFSPESGNMGLWAPLDFLSQVGIGVFFAEPYDPKRIPILFVSGAGGYPQEWRTYVESLDHTRYQAWFFVYPSGQRLEYSAAILQRCVEDLRKRYGFERLYLTAHSMGGLVSRGFIQRAREAGDISYLRLFVSVSTPWEGHRAAVYGVEYSPAVIPSWIDMQTNSQYQQAIFARPFGQSLAYYLFYSQVDPKAPREKADDGAVTVISQLRPEAVRDAREVLGFTENHDSILISRNAIAAYQRILSSVK